MVRLPLPTVKAPHILTTALIRVLLLDPVAALNIPFAFIVIMLMLIVIGHRAI